jgi:hypothetical protein
MLSNVKFTQRDLADGSRALAPFAASKDHRGFDPISDALPFGRLWYGEPNAVANAIGYAQFLQPFT